MYTHPRYSNGERYGNVNQRTEDSGTGSWLVEKGKIYLNEIECFLPTYCKTDSIFVHQHRVETGDKTSIRLKNRPCQQIIRMTDTSFASFSQGNTNFDFFNHDGLPATSTFSVLAMFAMLCKSHNGVNWLDCALAAWDIFYWGSCVRSSDNQNHSLNEPTFRSIFSNYV